MDEDADKQLILNETLGHESLLRTPSAKAGTVRLLTPIQSPRKTVILFALMWQQKQLPKRAQCHPTNPMALKSSGIIS